MADIKLYLIWSNEHDAWWAPNSQGYTPDANKAGRYEEWEAFQIVRKANHHLDFNKNELQEVMVPIYANDEVAKVVECSANKAASCDCDCDCGNCAVCEEGCCKECSCYPCQCAECRVTCDECGCRCNCMCIEGVCKECGCDKT